MIVRKVIFEKIRKLSVIIGLVSCSIYLMSLVNQITLTSHLQRIFVVIYFMVVIPIIYKIIKKWSKFNLNESNKRLINTVSILIIVFVLALCRNIIIPQNNMLNEIKIVSLNNKNVDSGGYETWISAIEINDKPIDLELSNKDTLMWELKNNTLFADGANGENALYLNIPKGQNTKIHFIKHGWSGKVLVESSVDKKEYDLYDIAGGEFVVDIPIISLGYNKLEQAVLLLGLFILLYELVTFILSKLLHLVVGRKRVRQK